MISATYLVSFDPDGFDILQDSDKETKKYSLKTISTHYTAWRYNLEQKKKQCVHVLSKHFLCMFQEEKRCSAHNIAYLNATEYDKIVWSLHHGIYLALVVLSTSAFSIKRFNLEPSQMRFPCSPDKAAETKSYPLCMCMCVLHTFTHSLHSIHCVFQWQQMQIMRI